MAVDTRRYITEDRSLNSPLHQIASRATNLCFEEAREITDLRANEINELANLQDGQELLVDGWCWFRRQDDQEVPVPGIRVLTETDIDLWSDYYDTYGDLPEEAVVSLFTTARAGWALTRN